MKHDRTSRILHLLAILQDGEHHPLADMIKILGVSRRTVFRDLKCLERSQICVVHRKGLGYALQSPSHLPIPDLTASEVLGLLLLGKVAFLQREDPLIKEGISGLHKMLATAPNDLTANCRDLASHIQVEDPNRPLTQNTRKHFQTILHAIDEKQPCLVSTTSSSRTLAQQDVIVPKMLFLKRTGWVVSGSQEPDGQELEVELALIDQVRVY